MGVITLPANVETDRQNGIKANSVHVQNNFDTLLTAVNNKLEKDGSILPTSDLPMNGYKIIGMATPTLSGDAATKGYVDNNACMLAGAQTITGNKDFTGTTTAVTQSVSDDSTALATTGFIKDVLETIYPVGSLYIGTQNSCPMASVMSGTTWTLVSGGYALWTGNGGSSIGVTPNEDYANASANTTIAAGLPNITGAWNDKIAFYNTHTASGAIQGTGINDGAEAGIAGNPKQAGYTFDASRSSSIYGNSTTNQPPAYVVNVWRRTA